MRKPCAVFFLILALPLAAAGQGVGPVPYDIERWPWNFVAKSRPDYVRSLVSPLQVSPPYTGEPRQMTPAMVLQRQAETLMRVNEASLEMDRAAELVRASKFLEAEEVLLKIRDVMATSPSYQELMVAVYVGSRQIDKAYEFCSQTIVSSSPGSLVSAAAMVVGLRGEVYDDQIEYCRDAVRGSMPETLDDSSFELPPFATKRDETIVWGAVAAGIANHTGYRKHLSELYLLIALDHQPDNPLANFRLGRIRQQQELYDEARRYLLRAQQTAKGGLAGLVREELAFVEEKIKGGSA